MVGPESPSLSARVEGLEMGGFFGCVVDVVVLLRTMSLSLGNSLTMAAITCTRSSGLHILTLSTIFVSGALVHLRFSDCLWVWPIHNPFRFLLRGEFPSKSHAAQTSSEHLMEPNQINNHDPVYSQKKLYFKSS